MVGLKILKGGILDVGGERGGEEPPELEGEIKTRFLLSLPSNHQHRIFHPTALLPFSLFPSHYDS